MPTMTLTRCCHRQALWIISSHLLSFRRVGLGVHFEERKLLTVVVIHPFTEVVADVKPSAERNNNESGQNSVYELAHWIFPIVFFACVWLKLRYWKSLTTPSNLSSGSLKCGHTPGCAARVFFVLFVLPAVGGLRCSLHESCICWIRCAGVYVLGFREAYRAFSQSSLLSFKVKSCQMHQSPAFCGLKVCKHD